MLKLAKNLTLPVDTVTQTIAILAKRRAGKSYAMRRLVEQLFESGQQVVLVDPKGDQWGIRSTADGKNPGLPIVILGGERGDVPLESSGGEIVAKLVVEEQVSILLDVSLFRKHEVATFMTAFLENLYRLKAREIYRTPMMLVIDEADAIAPQKPQKGEERMLGAAEDIVRRGGQRGIGCVLVTQRSAVLNKNVLTQAQMLVALRTIAPQDLAAMDAWIQVHGEPEQRKTLMESLPSLPVGDAWFWSPGWPTTAGIFKRVHVLPIETFDSGATPKPGEKRVQPKNLADVDLEALTLRMAATIERAKADDPRELRKKIAELEKQLKATPATAPQVVKEPVEVKVPVIDEQQFRTIQTTLSDAMSGVAEANDNLRDLKEYVAQIRKAVSEFKLSQSRPIITHNGRKPMMVSPESIRRVKEAVAGQLPPAKQKILNGLAFLEGIGVTTADKTQLALLVGVSPTSGGYFNNLGALRSDNLIEYPSGGTAMLTDAGRAVANTDGVPTNTTELHQSLSARLPAAKWRILKALIDAYPDAIQKDALAKQLGVSPTSGGYFNNLGSLRSLGLIDYPQPGTAKAKSVLFLE